ncbi:hypothetical protein BVG16_13740 [Paenibacillus selenitireducens]|uniref:Head-tail adaptor protein n=1 Tax=Paenibacillus selenitireducens TaxID=1324314 RepID=A0A1T2XCE0_9BACL|nr:hypothetical protein [Paenibacillus selenitireducens]OPA77510.1 hypothetical protein BVG16_13740 [Paenibacillus selenitireducens]
MRNFRFASIVRKYFRPYVQVQESEGKRDEDGVWIPSEPILKSLQGHIQPISAELQQVEGGRYTKTDRMLFTESSHESGDIIGYQGNRYTVGTEVEREYSDINQYVIKKVIVSDTV